MSAPSHDDDQLKLEIFDSFSKTVMRNASRNFAAAAKTRRKNESVNTDIVQYILKTHGENAVYPSEHFIDAGNGYCCVVATEWLYQAMLLLPPKQKEVVILEFWYGMSISEISETLRISRRSVSERKKNAFANIRSYYERTQKHETGLCFSSMVQIEQVERLVVSFSCKTCHRITFPIWKMHGSL